MLSSWRLFSCFIVTLFARVNSQGVVERYFDQRLDHNGSNTDTFKQRYLENQEYFKAGGPIYLTIGGPYWYSPVAPETIQKGSMAQYAKDAGAAIIILENRYYGKSRPTSDLSVANFEKYFTIEHALNDLAAFVRYLKTQPDYSNSKVVGFGHSYMGTRFLQLMRTQPGLIDIGVLSSTIVETRVEFNDFMKKAFNIMEKSNPSCATSIRNAVVCFDKVVHGEECGGHNVNDIKDTFNLCTVPDPNNNLDSSALVAETLNTLSYITLFNNPKAKYNVDIMCRGMTDNSTGLTELERLAREVKTIIGGSGQPCLEYKFEDILKRMGSNDWDTPGTIRGDRQIFYSRCRYSMTMRTPLGIELGAGRVESFRNYTFELCYRLFQLTKEQVTEGAAMTNELYGKRRIPEKCAIFVTEGEDLLQELEITDQKEVGNCNQVVKSEGGSFISDSTDIEDELGKGVKEAKLRVENLLNQWLKTGDCCAPVAKRIFEYQPRLIRLNR